MFKNTSHVAYDTMAHIRSEKDTKKEFEIKTRQILNINISLSTKYRKLKTCREKNGSCIMKIHKIKQTNLLYNSIA